MGSKTNNIKQLPAELWDLFEDLSKFSEYTLKGEEYLADSLVLESLFAVSNRMKKKEPISNLRKYCFTTLKNKIRNYQTMKIKVRNAEALFSKDFNEAFSTLDQLKFPIQEDDFLERIFALILTLKSKSQIIFVLSFLQDMSAPQIASELEMKANTINKHRQLILERIRKHFKIHNDDSVITFF